jgi:uncharacterized phage protein (TIGR02218 family)
MSVTTLSTCWKLKLKDKRILGFTDFIRDLDIDGVIYKAKSGFSSSAIESDISLSADNLEISGFLDSDIIDKEDLLSGIYDHAYLEIFIMNYQDIKLSPFILKSGYLGEIRLKNNQFTAEVIGITDVLSNQIGKLYSPTCRARFAGKECRVSDYPIIKCKILKRYSSTQILINKAISGMFNYGVAEFKVGRDISIPVRECNGKIVTFAFSIPDEVKARTQCIIRSGCDKKLSTCSDIYNNAVNFRGEPHIPGVDEIHKTAGTFK